MFKDTEHFFVNVGHSRSTVYFKILLYKFLKKYPLLKKSTLKSCYFKNCKSRLLAKKNPTFYA